MAWQDRISIDPKVLLGKPVVRGTRISVEHVLRVMGDGWSVPDVLRAYPNLSIEDVHACMAYAGQILAQERAFPLSA